MINTDIKQLKAVFASRFRELRNNRKNTQSELSEILNCSQQTINVWENPQTDETEKDVNFPTTKALLRISDFFNVSIDWLFGKDEPVKILLQIPTEYVSLITEYKKLNETGQNKVMTYIKDLLGNPTNTQKEKTSSAS